MIFVLDPTTGKTVQVLSNTLGTGQGMTFDSVGNLYVALQSGYLGVFTNQAAGPTAFGHYPTADNLAYSLVIDPSGNPIVSELFVIGDQQPTVLQYPSGAGPTGPPSATFYPAYDTSNVPAFWVELLDTSDTIAYTLGGNTVKVFDLGEQLQHPDIVPNRVLTTPTLYALRELPDTSLLVANGNQIVRMSQTGTVLNTYAVGTSPLFQNLNLDPDGVSFWTNDELSGTVFRINIATGAVMNGTGFTTNLGFGPTVVTPGIGGIAVFGQPQSGGADVSVAMSAAPSPVTQGANLTYTITVTNNGPLTANAVTMTDVLPAGATFVSATSTVGTCSGTTTVTCTLGTMNSSASATITLVVTAATAGVLTNPANVTSTTPDPNALNNSATSNTTVTGSQSFTLTVTESGSGTVTSTQPPNAILCPSTCSASFGSGTSVTLSATPNSGSTFSAWSGACNATSGTCTVTMNQPQNVTATFGTTSGGLTFPFTTLPAGAVTVPYGADILVTGGTPPYTFAVANGSSLPTGFSLDATANGNAAPGHVSNIAPTSAGTFTFGVTVTDSTTPTPLTGNATVSLTIAPMPANTQPGLLKGKYAMLLRGFNEVTGVEEGVVGSLTFDGTGNITGGALDINSTGTIGIASNIAATGLYVIGPDNRGVMSITPAGQTPGIFTFSVGNVLNGLASTAYITSFNDNSGTGDLYAGTLRLQDPTSFNNAGFAGTYVYDNTGQDPAGHRAAEIGLTTLDAANAVTSGSADTNVNGFTGSVKTITGTYTTPDSNGRSLLSLTVNTTPSSVVVYQISANEVLHMTLDARATATLLLGTAERQLNPNAFSNTSLTGPDIFSLVGTTGTQGTSASIGLVTVTPGTTPTVNVTLDTNDNGTVTIGRTLTGPLSIAANGRGTMSPGENVLIFYLTQPDHGFAMSSVSSVDFGPIVPQVGAPFSATPFANNNLFFGQQEAAQGHSSEFSGIATIGTASSLTATDDEAHNGGNLFFNQALGSFTYGVTPTGHFTLTSSAQGNSSGYVVSPFEVVFFDTTGPASDPTPSARPHVGVVQSIPAQVSSVILAPTSLTFNSQTIGTTSAAQTVTLTNGGSVALAISGITLTGPNSGDFAETNTCPASLAVDANCTISVTFTPTAAGTRTAAISIADNATGSPQTVALTGTVNGPATVTVTPSSLTFASQFVNSTSAPQSVTVTNTGTGPITFTSFSITGSGSSSFALANGTNACNPTGTLAASAACTIGVTFTPTATGELVATLSIADSAPGSPQTVALNGTGNNSPITISIPPGGSTTGTATPGGTAFYGLQITSAPGVTGTVQLGCTPSSPTITCTVIPSSIVLTGKPIEVAFGIQTFCQGATGTGFVPGAPVSGPAGGIGLLLLSLLMGGLVWVTQRNRRLALTFAVLTLVALGTAACASLPKGPNGATPPGTYTLTLTTTVNGQTQTLPNFLTLVVR
jgi:uncharacterized repeat protein (TIGR01451 family)